MADTKVNVTPADEPKSTAKVPTNWGQFVAEAEEVEAGATVSISDIPEDIKQAVERSYGSGNYLRFRLPSAKVADEFLNLARTYCSLREPKLTIRTTKLEDVPDGTIQWRAKDFEARVRKA